MPNIVFVQPSGDSKTVDAKAGHSVMHASLTHHVAGILGECGGSMTCATCHVYVDPEWMSRLPPMSDQEGEMLDFAAAARMDGSRLACQIEMTDALDGLRLALPAVQI
jgi:2Fe-2S ferredoxin